MKLKSLKVSWQKLLFLIMMLMSLYTLSGCISLGRDSTILTSKDMFWTIPKGAKFQATQKPLHKELTDFIADDSLLVMYKGTYLNLQKETNAKTFKRVRAAKQRGLMIGTIGAIFTFLGGAVGIKKLKKGKK